MRRTHALVAGIVVKVAVNCCGQTDEPVQKIDTPPMDPAIVAACVRMLSCSAEVTFDSVSGCILENVGPLRNPDPARIVTGIRADLDTRSAGKACINDASAACDMIQRCVSGDRGDCTGIPQGRALCDGVKRITCESGRRHELDCTSKDCELTRACDYEPPASGCLVGADGNGECGSGSCVEATFEQSCDGNAIVFCYNGVIKRSECGATCKKDAAGVRCAEITEPPSCTPDVAAHCEGTDIVSCEAGHERRESCGVYPLPMTCASSHRCAGLAIGRTCLACVLSAQVRCDATHRDICRGDEVVYCDGQERSIDCHALGFTSCVATPHGAACR